MTNELQDTEREFCLICDNRETPTD